MLANATFYRCDVLVGVLPMNGMEVMYLLLLLLFALVCLGTTFFAVVLRQLFPSMLDPAAAARIVDIQRTFPNLDLSDSMKQLIREGKPLPAADANGVPVKEHVLLAEDGVTPIRYDSIAVQSPYITTKTVDEDLCVMLASNDAYSTVSDYCSSSVRGNVMLSTMLLSSAMCLSFMWFTRLILDPAAASSKSWWTYLDLVGTLAISCTGLCMDHTPDSPPVFRRDNIVLWFNFPYSLKNGKKNPWLGLHMLGVIGFILLPLIGHAISALQKPTPPDAHVTLTGCAFQLVAAICFGLSGSLADKIPGYTKLFSKKIQILFETILFLGSYMVYARYLFFPAAYCVGKVKEFDYLILVAIFLPFGFILKEAQAFCWSPKSFKTPPSLLLMLNGQPVAQSGPCSAIEYHGEDVYSGDDGDDDSETLPKKDLPRVQAVIKKKL